MENRRSSLYTVVTMSEAKRETLRTIDILSGEHFIRNVFKLGPRQLWLFLYRISKYVKLGSVGLVLG